MRILAVDDDPLILELLQSPMWLGANHDLVCVESAAAALTAIAVTATPFDAFLLDIVMPVRDGIDLCTAIRALPDYIATPIIMITASREIDMMQRAFDAGATDYVNKPLDGLELGTRINMAALLNDSITREKSARRVLETLPHRAALGFDDKPHQCRTDGLVRYMALENDLLALPKGCHALSLFSIRVAPFAVAMDDPHDADIIEKLLLISQTITRSLAVPSAQIAYIGRGIFVCVTFGRTREQLGKLDHAVTAALKRQWRDARMTPAAPRLTSQPIATLGVWTSRAAVEALRSFIASQVRTVDPTIDAEAAVLANSMADIDV